MNGREILEVFVNKHSDLLPYFHGIAAIDTLETLPINKIVIINKSKINSKGSHWFVICRPNKTQLEVFDSLGTDFDLIKKYVHIPKVTQIVGNKTIFQSATSNTCPLFCIYFCVAKVLNPGVLYDELLDYIFPSNNISKCEEIVHTFHNTGKFYLDEQCKT
jgi:hypothetical protein